MLLNCKTELATALADLTTEERAHPAIRHAMSIHSALASSNYHTFFKLYLNAPNMSGHLLDLFVQRERVQALKAMVKSWVVFVFYLLGHLMICSYALFHFKKKCCFAFVKFES